MFSHGFHSGNSRIDIFSLTGSPVKTFEKIDGGKADWDLKNITGEEISSGIYIYLVRDIAGKKKTGKIAVIR
ncbi:MAG: hypothetical protein AB1633_07100 [Elusimicrobiota bacterium]